MTRDLVSSSLVSSRLISRYLIMRITLLMTTCVVCACERSDVRGLDDRLTPLLTLSASLSLEELNAMTPETRAQLRAGVVWLAPSFPSAWCSDQLARVLASSGALGEVLGGAGGQRSGEEQSSGGDADREGGEGEAGSSEFMITPELLSEVTTLSEVCGDPFRVASQLAGPSVSIAEGVERAGRLELSIPFTALPPSDVIYGTPDARIAYGALVVFADLDANETFSIGDSERLRFASTGDTDSDDRSDERRRWRGEPTLPDRVYSASFTSLLTPQMRLVFREGDYAPSLFYPLGAGCTPPRGMSFVKISEPTLDLTSSVECEVIETTAPVNVRLAVATDELSQLEHLACEPPDIEMIEPATLPPSLEGGRSLEERCVSPDELVLSSADHECSDLSVVTLLGCPAGEVNCSAPLWDQRSAPPGWWPCAVESSEAGSEAGETGSEASEAGSETSEAGSEASEAGSEASEAGSEAGSEAEDAGNAEEAGGAERDAP